MLTHRTVLLVLWLRLGDKPSGEPLVRRSIVPGLERGGRDQPRATEQTPLVRSTTKSRGPRPLCSLLWLCVGFVALRRSESSLCRYHQATAGCLAVRRSPFYIATAECSMSVSDGRAAQVRMVRQYTSPRSSHSKAHLAGLFAARCLLRAQRVGLRLLAWFGSRRSPKASVSSISPSDETIRLLFAAGLMYAFCFAASSPGIAYHEHGPRQSSRPG